MHWPLMNWQYGSCTHWNEFGINEQSHWVPTLQSRWRVKAPVHGVPSSAGSVTTRYEVCVPPSQGREQFDHVDQSLYRHSSACTGMHLC